MKAPPQLSGLTDAFGKDAEHESDLAALNDLLAPAEHRLRENHEAPSRPIVFVVGPPRSGTTLVSQVLTASGGFGAISNFVARFWKAPALGLMIERSVGAATGAEDYDSVRGVTAGISAPHEFGYFWSSWFDLGQTTHALTKQQRTKIDTAGLQRALAAMEAVADKPLAFKNNTWLTFQADWISTVFPKSIIVACSRDPYFVAQSLYLQRQILYDDVSKWWSVRPTAYARLRALDPIEQVAAQAVEVARDMTKALEPIPAHRIVHSDYADFCADPRGILTTIGAACARMGETPELSTDRVPDRFHSTDQIRLAPAIAKRLKESVAKRLAGC